MCINKMNIVIVGIIISKTRLISNILAKWYHIKRLWWPYTRKSQNMNMQGSILIFARVREHVVSYLITLCLISDILFFIYLTSLNKWKYFEMGFSFFHNGMQIPCRQSLHFSLLVFKCSTCSQLLVHRSYWHWLEKKTYTLRGCGKSRVWKNKEKEKK